MPAIYEKQFTVQKFETAKQIASGGLEVLSTPHMIGYMENAAWEMMEEIVEPGQTTVGIELNIKHLAPTVVGKQVDVKATLVEDNGKVYTFHVEASADGNIIGGGTHKRAVVNEEKFMASIK